MKPKILFVCIGNTCRSQMAEGLARTLSKNNAEVFSAGSKPAGFVSPDAIQIMKESGIDISKHYSKGVTQVPQEKYDAVISMGCGDACPQIPAQLRLDWNIPDPIGKDLDFFRQVKAQLESHITPLVNDLLSAKQS